MTELNTTAEQLDALDVPASSVDTSFPLLVASQYKMKLQNCRVEQNKAQTGDNLIVEHVLDQDGHTTKGDILEASRITLTRWTGLTVLPAKEGKKKGRTLEDIKRDLAQLIKAAKLPAETKLSDVKNNPSLLNERQVLAKVSVRAAQGSYPETNDITGYVIEG